MKRNQMFPSKYLNAGDLQGRPQVVVIENVAMEEVGDDQRSKPVMSFRNRGKGLVLNATNHDLISAIYGDETDDWSGQPIELYPTKVDFKGRRTDAIRVRAPQVSQQKTVKAPESAKSSPAPITEELNDEIPW